MLNWILEGPESSARVSTCYFVNAVKNTEIEKRHKIIKQIGQWKQSESKGFKNQGNEGRGNGCICEGVQLVLIPREPKDCSLTIL